MRNLLILLIACFYTNAIAQKHLDILVNNQDISAEELRSEMETWYQATDDLHKERIMKKFNRWLFWNDGTTDAEGRTLNSANQIWSAYHKYLRLIPDPDQRNQNGQWEDYTPDNWAGSTDNVQGRISSIAIHPTNSNIIYVGSAMGGLWKSTDAGTTWNNLTQGLPVIGVSGIVIHKNNPDTLYIVTGEADGMDVPSIGILKSTDGGLTWGQTGLVFDLEEDDLYFGYKLVAHPENPDTMFLATNQRLYFTTNGWDTKSYRLDGFPTYDLEFRPGSPDVMYAVSSLIVRRSMNGGLNWEILSGNATGLPIVNGTVRLALAVTDQDPLALYALHAGNGTGNGYLGLYVSQDGGDTWSVKTDNLNIVGAGTYNQSHYNLVMEIDPADSNTIYTGGISVYKSTSAGDQGSWFYAGEGCHADNHAYLWRDGALYVGSDGGLAKSTDGGGTWQNLSVGLKIRQFYSLAVDENRIIAGAQDNGTSKWFKGDGVGKQVMGGDGLQPVLHPFDTSIVYATTQEDRFKSTNGGNTSTDYSNILPVDLRGDIWSAPWVLHPDKPDTMYMGISDGRLLRNFNGGNINDWVVIDSNYAERIVTMAVSKSDPEVAYCSDRNVIRRTGNLNAASPQWIDRSNDLSEPDIKLVELVIDPTDKSRVWALYWNYYDTVKVYFTENSGVAWSNWSQGLPNVRFRSMVYQEGSNDGIYIGGELGVFYRNASMSEWEYFSNGLPNTRVSDLVIQDGHLYAATYGNGVWRSPLIASCPNSMNILADTAPHGSADVGTRVYEAVSTISTTLILDSNLGTNVTMRAGNYVRFDVGAEIKAGAELHAQIGGCDN